MKPAVLRYEFSKLVKICCFFIIFTIVLRASVGIVNWQRQTIGVSRGGIYGLSAPSKLYDTFS